MSAILLSVVGVLVSFVVAILCYFLKGILEEMKSMNLKLVNVITNQEWHYKSIIELQAKVESLDKQVNRHKKGVDLC